MAQFAVGAPVVFCGCLVLWAMIDGARKPGGDWALWVVQAAMLLAAVTTIAVGAMLAIGESPVN